MPKLKSYTTTINANNHKLKLKNARLGGVSKRARKSIEDRIAEVELADQELIDLAYPDSSGSRAIVMRELFTAFLASLRPANNTAGNKRAVSGYLPGDTLLNLFKSRQYFIEIRNLKAEDSLSRLLGLIIDDHQRLIQLINNKELVLNKSEKSKSDSNKTQ